MTPRTRSGGKPAPDDKVYTSGTAPKLQQARFPARRTTVRGYGRRTPRRKLTEAPVEDPEDETKSSPQQKTLTQMLWTTSVPLDLEGDLNTEQNEESSRASRSRSRKRRKTEGDVPSSPPPSKPFKTQTLTQMGSFSSKNDDDPFLIDDVPSDEDAPAKPADSPTAADKGKRKASATPQTPSTRRVRLEIPSSQGSASPLTPMLERYGPANSTRSPLKDKSTNIMSPLRKFPELSKAPGSSKRPRTLVVEDSYATTATKSPASSVENHSPAKPHTQHKSVRFVTPSVHEASQVLGDRAPLGDITEEMAQEASSEESDAPASPSPLRPRSIAPDREIADSDDDFELWDENDQEEEDDDEPYGAVGKKTQLLVEAVVSSAEKQASLDKPSPSPPLAHSDTSVDIPASSALVTAQAQSSSFSEVATVRLSSPPQLLPRAPPALAASSSFNEVATVRLSSPPQCLPPIAALGQSSQAQPDDGSPHDSEPQLPLTQARTQYETQGLESQRIPLDIIRSMGPQTDRSDIFVSIHPQHIEKIITRTKNHEFRNYKIPAFVTRMWFYITAPASRLQYMARISGAKQPGELTDETGAGNKDFNARKGTAKFAYELLDVYELNNPVPLAEMKEHGWVESAPQKYTYVPPAVVGHLMANLRCSVFGTDEEDEDTEDSLDKMLGKPSSQLQVTVSQEVTNQILSEATQHTSDPACVVPSSQESERAITSMSTSTPKAKEPYFKRPEQPMSTPYKRPTNPTPKRASVRPSQATTVSQVSSFSSSPIKGTPHAADESSNTQQLPPLADEQESFVPPASSSLHIRSSQLLTKSQMLPESLRSADFSELGDDVDIVYDSEADMDEL